MFRSKFAQLCHKCNADCLTTPAAESEVRTGAAVHHPLLRDPRDHFRSVQVITLQLQPQLRPAWNSSLRLVCAAWRRFGEDGPQCRRDLREAV